MKKKKNSRYFVTFSLQCNNVIVTLYNRVKKEGVSVIYVIYVVSCFQVSHFLTETKKSEFFHYERILPLKKKILTFYVGRSNQSKDGT